MTFNNYSYDFMILILLGSKKSLTAFRHITFSKINLGLAIIVVR